MRPPTPNDTEEAIRQAMQAGRWGEAEKLGAQLDRQPRPAGLISAALWYATQGLPVFPLQPGAKIPLPGSRGCLEATTDQAVIIQWWTARPDANIGLATGHTVDVIDIDGALGVRSWCAHWDDLPIPLGVVNTPRPGGTHLYIEALGGGNRAAVLPGVDLRGKGGYVVAPPSILGPDPSRAYHGAYTWRSPLSIASAA